jgi:hypothetical protein
MLVGLGRVETTEQEAGLEGFYPPAVDRTGYRRMTPPRKLAVKVMFLGEPRYVVI